MKKKLIIGLIIVLISVGSGTASYLITMNHVSKSTNVLSDKNSKDEDKVTIDTIKSFVQPILTSKLSTASFNLSTSSANATYTLEETGFKYNFDKIFADIYAYGRANKDLKDDKKLYEDYVAKNTIAPVLSKDDYDIFLGKIKDKFSIKGVKPTVQFNSDSVSISGGSSRYDINDKKLYSALVDSVNDDSFKYDKIKSIDINVPLDETSYTVSEDVQKKMTVLGTYSTRVTSMYTGRTKNIQLFLSKLSNNVIMPGEVFSCDKTAGSREVSDGYSAAPSFVNNKVVNMVAGGICQGVTTMYNAAVYADLEIVEREPHSLPVTYIQLGRDATIAHGSIDLKFKNNKNYPIVTQAYVTNSGQVTATIWGVNEEPGKKIEITVKSRGGNRTTTYKNTYMNGTLTKSEVLSTDSYN